MNRKKSVDNTGVKEFNREEYSKEIGMEIPSHIKDEFELFLWLVKRGFDMLIKFLEENQQKQE